MGQASLTERDKHGVELQPFDGRRISGIATMGRNRPDGGYFDCEPITHVTGNLWQGGCLEGLDLPSDFKHVVSLYPWGQWAAPAGCKEHVFALYDDAGGVDGTTIDTIAKLVNECRREGKTLVHCQAGLNRSALVTARALMLDGMSADDAITLLRKRSPMVLCNLTFEAWLREQ